MKSNTSDRTCLRWKRQTGTTPKGITTQKLEDTQKKTPPQATGGANEGHKDRTGTKTGKVRKVDIPGTLI